VAGSAVDAGLELAPGPAENRLFASGSRKSSCRKLCLFANVIGMPAGLLGMGDAALTGGCCEGLALPFARTFMTNVTCLKIEGQ